jgi:nucleotide-binding universal stress UspA family protein
MTEIGERIVPASAEIPSFTRILFVTDFSAPSVAAAPFAALLAEYYRAFVVVAHVVSVEPQADGVTQAPAEIDKAREAAEAQLRKFVAENPLGECDYEAIVGQGSVWEVLADLVEGKRIDLVVLGTHGRSGVGKLLLGSVAQRIFSLAPCPVLSVSPRARKSWGPDHRLSRILYATDFSPASLKALPYALSLAKVSHAELVLLHAPEPSEATSSEILMGYHQHLSALIPAQHRSWCRSDTLVTVGDPARAILDAAAKNSADLIVVGARAYEGSLASFQVPLSIAYRVVAHAPCPVLRVRS